MCFRSFLIIKEEINVVANSTMMQLSNGKNLAICICSRLWKIVLMDIILYIVLIQCALLNKFYCFEWHVNKAAQNHDHLDFCNIRNHARIYSHWTSMKKELQHRRSQIIDMKNEKFLHKWQVKVKHVISHMRLQKLHMYIQYSHQHFMFSREFRYIIFQ